MGTIRGRKEERCKQQYDVKRSMNYLGRRGGKELDKKDRTPEWSRAFLIKLQKRKK